MRIPVFVSAPTALNPEQASVHAAIIAALNDLGLEERRLGESDYPEELPLKEVIQIARRCAGGVVLGFVQFMATSGVEKPGVKDRQKSVEGVPFPTPWNNLEAGILFGLRLPMLIFKEPGISGGVFDVGTSEVFVHKMPAVAELQARASGVQQVLLKWQGRVRNRYYEWEE